MRNHTKCTKHPNFLAAQKRKTERLKAQKCERVTVYLASPKICQHKQCDNIIEYDKRHTSRFCSSSCAASSNNRGRKPKHTRLKTCKTQNCGNQFIFLPYVKQQFCSQACSTQHKIDKQDLLIEQGKVHQRRSLRRYMIEQQGYSCSVCNLTDWQGQPIPLELDHIDGDATNNMPSNLRIICPNCHAQTETYKARNKGNGRQSRGLRSC